MSTVLVEEDANGVARRAAAWIAALIEAVVSARGACSVALAGGSTPRLTYEVLGGAAFDTLPFDRVSWFFGDERAVPPNHPESNYRMVARSLFASRPKHLDQVFRMPAEAADSRLASDAYGGLLPDPLDLVVLGMGEDGHTASLFPGSPALGEQEARVAVVTGPKAPFRRMTVTPPVIDEAVALLVLVTGEAKAAMVSRALEGELEVHEVPAQLARRGTWILDRAAATLLRMPGGS